MLLAEMSPLYREPSLTPKYCMHELSLSQMALDVIEENPDDPRSFRAVSVLPRRLPNFLLFPLFGQSRWGHSRQFLSACTGQRGPTRKLRQFCYACSSPCPGAASHAHINDCFTSHALVALSPVRSAVTDEMQNRLSLVHCGDGATLFDLSCPRICARAQQQVTG